MALVLALYHSVISCS